MTAPDTRTPATRPADPPQLADALAVIAAELAGSAQALQHIAQYLVTRPTAGEPVGTCGSHPHATAPEPRHPARSVLSGLLRHGPELVVGIIVTVVAVAISAYLFQESFR